MTIGIPRALIYWKQPYFWETFFEELGFKVLLSPSTNKEIVEMGVKVADPETCFSNKVYFGHLIWLDYSPPAVPKCDFIFVPRLKAVAEHSFISHSHFAWVTEEKLEYCPKFFGLPDLSKILVKTPILTETFDERKENFKKTLQRLGKKLKKNKEETKRAFETASLKEKELKQKEEKDFLEKIKSQKPKIVLISHPYNLYDEYVNLRMKEKLEKLGAEPIFVDEVPNPKSDRSPFLMGWVAQPFLKGCGEILNKSQIPNLNWPKFHWEFGNEIMEKIQRILSYNIAGVIEISSFGCGCDAVIKEFVEKTFKENKIPFLYLMIDEQAGEAGIQTRLEAFMDTI